MSTGTNLEWFSVDKEGLAKLVERRGKVFVLHELLQNSWDCEGSTYVSVNLKPIENKPYALLAVDDDHPEGFADLTHAYTLFAESEKKKHSSKRGRFNLGEKLVLSLCESAEISSTTGSVLFSRDKGRRRTRHRTAHGTSFKAVLRITREELSSALEEVFKVIPPDNIRTTINGDLIAPRPPIESFTAFLQTEVATETGHLTRRYRDTLVTIHDIEPGEKPHIYEMGIPVMELTDDPWHINVHQKVPMGMERDAVTSMFLSDVRGAVLDHMHTHLEPRQAKGKWVSEALEMSENSEAVKSIVLLRFGDKVVIADPSDREGENIAKARGYTVIPGGTFTADAWDKIKDAGAALPAGQVTPSPKPFSPNGEMLEMIDYHDLSFREKEFAKYVQWFGSAIAGMKVVVTEFTRTPSWGFRATHTKLGEDACQLIFNLAKLGDGFFDSAIETNKLLIHEFGHQWGHHLEESYHEAICRLGAIAINFARVSPEKFAFGGNGVE